MSFTDMASQGNDLLSREAPAVQEDHRLLTVRDFYNGAGRCDTWAGRSYRSILAQYYLKWISPGSKILEVGCGDGELLSYFKQHDVTGVDISKAQIALAQLKIPKGRFFIQAGEQLQLEETFDYIILSETVNQASDVHRLFERLKTVSHTKTRLIFNFYQTKWRSVLELATKFGLKAKQPPSNWLTPEDVQQMLALTDWELIKEQKRILMPISVFGLERFINRYVAPYLPSLCLTTFQVARPARPSYPERPSVSIVIPVRNEAGNVRAALQRMPKLGRHTEIIFIEGHSKDATWEEVLRVAEEQKNQWDIVALQQTKKGKGNAVREAFERAKGDILIILDGDLTVPPEELFKFYEVLASGKAEFCNGVRLVYPMERQAMRFLNLCANHFFGRVFSWALGQKIKDTLCGTKALFKKDYEKIAANRHYFGDFDPFGDFDLLFGADHLLLKIVDIPIRYRDRTYGQTNIKRWRHGWLLLRMLMVAIRKLKLG